MRRCLSIGLLACLAGTMPAAAQEAQDWNGLLEANRPLAAASALAQAQGMEQVHAQVAVFLGEEGPSCQLRGGGGLPQDVVWRDALEVIGGLAEGRRVVMLNESHFRGVHRAFLAQLVELLHAQGFDALAAETFVPGAPERLRGAGPDTLTGFYSADPLFAAALRRARQLGWEFVHYEAADGDGREAREEGQARHLAAWLQAHPGRRLLVHAGGQHVSESPAEGWMAARLAALTGLDPLTVHQATTACPGQATAWPPDAERALVPLRDGRPLPAGGADIAIVHPPAAVAAARGVLGRPVRICAAEADEPTLLRAFAAGDGELAIAHDQRLVAAAAGGAVLHLLPGRYRIERESTGGRRVLGEVEVEAGGGEDGGPSGACLAPQPGQGGQA